jgi:glycosyltransferase involved in cell wall biosynthesis
MPIAMIRILHVVSYFPPDRMGGVGEVVAHVHRALRSAGHQSTVLTAGSSNDDPSVRRVARSPGTFSLAAAKHVSLARDVNVVHIHHGEGVGLLAAMRIQRIDTPVLLTLHVSVAAMRRSLGPYLVGARKFHRDTPRGWTYRQVTMRIRSGLDRLAIGFADRVSFISRSAATDVMGSDAGNRALVVYNGVPPVSPDTDAPPASASLLFVGTNTERKRVELLPLILAEVRKRHPDARLCIVGLRPDENSEVVALARELDVLHAMDFAGHVPSGALGRYYQSARVLLVPSAYEGLPMVILEAMQYGLPVVATHVSGHPEVIDEGVNGFLVPLDDPTAMANAALRVLEDASLGSRLGANGRSTAASRFSVERQVTTYLAEYEHLVRNRRPS